MGNFCAYLSRSHLYPNRKSHVLLLLQQRHRQQGSNLLKVALLLPEDQTVNTHSLLLPQLQVFKDYI